MIADLRPYPEYQQSGLPWLGLVPGHWSQERAKWLFTKMTRPVGDNDGVVTCFRDGMVTLRKNRRLRGFTEAIYELGYQGIRKGDLVIHAMDAFAGAVGVSDSDGKATPVYAVCQPKEGVNAHYFAFIVREMARSHWILALSRGIRERSTDFRYETFGGQRVPLPPPQEQAAMVRFLDWADGRLGRAIRAKRKVIALLNEQKQAIIHRAVTRGLDPSVTLKASGVPWLGDIPAHWNVTRSKRLFIARKAPAWPDDVQLSATQAYGVIPQSDFEEKVGRRVVKIFMHLEKRRHVEKDDFVISMRSFQGGLERAWAPGAIRSSYVVLKAEKGVNTEFFAYLFKSRGYIRALQATGDFIRDGQDLNFDNFCRVDLPFVPTAEQAAIAAFIADSTVRLDKTIFRLEREITLLREYRTRLVADVVTGKLDARAAATRLPDEVAPDIAGDTDLSDNTEPADEEVVV